MGATGVTSIRVACRMPEWARAWIAKPGQTSRGSRVGDVFLQLVLLVGIHPTVIRRAFVLFESELIQLSIHHDPRLVLRISVPTVNVHIFNPNSEFIVRHEPTTTAQRGLHKGRALGLMDAIDAGMRFEHQECSHLRLRWSLRVGKPPRPRNSLFRPRIALSAILQNHC